MKKLIVLFSAVAALAACSKNEVVPAVSGENVEISYKVAPRTKADPQAFDTHNVFASWAYYLPSGKKWATIICLKARTGVTTGKMRKYSSEKKQEKVSPFLMAITFGKTRQLHTTGQRKVILHSSRIH